MGRGALLLKGLPKPRVLRFAMDCKSTGAGENSTKTRGWNTLVLPVFRCMRACACLAEREAQLRAVPVNELVNSMPESLISLNFTPIAQTDSSDS
jgi:hypothetical protein